MTTTTYEFTAFTEADLLGAGAEGSSVSCGDTFTMSGTATTCFEVTDNDAFLSGDNYCNENANDKYGQQASITGENGQEIGNGGQIYAEKYFWVCDDAGNWYVLLQIEQEGTNEEYFTFFNGYGYETPAEGTELTVYSGCNVTSNWVDYKCLDAGEKEVDPGWIKGRLTLDADCNDNEFNDDTGQWDEGVEGQTVQLLDLDGNVVAESVTNSNGDYMFDVAPGQYRVKFPEIDGMKFSEQDSGVAEHFDSDADENGLTDVITVGSGQTVANIDAGVKPETGSIEGRVFCDLDCDGVDGTATSGKGDNLLVNSGFEDNTLNNSGYNWEDLSSGWYNIGSQNANILEQDYGHGNATGDAIAELECGVILCQAVNVTEAGSYCLSFDISRRGHVDQDNKFQLFIDGALYETYVAQGQETIEIQLDLGAGTHRFDFKSLSQSYKGAGLDDVELRQEIDAVEPEPGKEGVVVVLLDANGDEVLDGNGDRIETVTDADGNYKFDDVPVGDYRVKFENPDGTEFTFQNVGDDDTIDSDVNGNGVSDVVSVVADQTTSDVDAGLKPVVELGSIAGRYFCDENQDGAETDGAGNFEAGVAGATVWLLKGGVVIASTTTDADGNYNFDDLEAGNYSVRFEDPDDVSSATEGKNFIAADQGDDATDSDVVNVGGAGNGNTATFTLGAGENKTDVDGGIEQQFMVCDDPDAVLIDFEGIDGDVGFEPFVAGQVIDNEYAAFGVTISAQRGANNDAANDAMVFDSANPTGGDGDLQTFNQGNLLIISEDNDSSDPDDAVGGVITFDFENPSRIFDLKIVDTEEGGTVELFDADGNSLGVIDLPNLSDGGLEQVMIDTDGVSQMVVTLNGSGAIDDICIVPGEPQPGSLSGRYFFDGDRDGLDNDGANGISGIQVELLDENGDPTGVTTTTDGQGNYSFGDLAAGTYGVKFTDPDTGRELTTQNANGNANDDIDSDASDIGGGMSVINGITVVAGADTPDNDAGVVELLGSISGRYFCDENRDGSETDGAGNFEAGVANAAVFLILEGSGVIASTTTDDDGNYSFVDRPAGNYSVRFQDPAGVSPATEGKTFIAADQGDDATDSDVVSIGGAGNGNTATFTLAAGEDKTDVDAGIEELPGSLSGRYFCDDDGDGFDNDGDTGGEGPGVAGIRVDLLDATGAETGRFTTTDDQGNYSFANLAAGSYGVRFAEGVLDKELTIQNADNDVSDDIDSDAMADNIGFAAITGIVVLPGQDTPDNDIGVTPANANPEAEDVAAAVCADDMATINLLDAVFDPDGDTVSITSISDDDETAGVGGSITLEGGGVATLNADGTVSFNPNGAYDDLVIRDSAMDQFDFTASDGNGGTDTAMANIKVCGALNTIETIAEGFVDANGDPLQASYRVDAVIGPDGFSVPTTVTASAPLDPRLEAILGPDGERTFDDNFAYCIDKDGLLEFFVDVPSNLYIVGDDAMNTGNAAIADAVDQEENLDIVTWILNQGFQDLDAGTLDDGDLGTAGTAGQNYSFNEVQSAIWFFTDGDPVDPSTPFGANSQEIIDLATVAGEGFVAEEGDLVAVLFDPLDEDRQTYMVGVEFETLKEDCDCIL